MLKIAGLDKYFSAVWTMPWRQYMPNGAYKDQSGPLRLPWPWSDCREEELISWNSIAILMINDCDILWSKTGHGWFQDHCCWKIWMSWKLLWRWASKTASTFEGLQKRCSTGVRIYEFCTKRLILHVWWLTTTQPRMYRKLHFSECSLSLSLRWRPIFLAFSWFFTEYVASLIFSKTKTNYRSYSGRRAVEVIWSALGQGSKSQSWCWDLLTFSGLFSYVTLERLFFYLTPVWSKFRVLFPLENHLTIFTLKSILHPLISMSSDTAARESNSFIALSCDWNTWIILEQVSLWILLTVLL